MMTSTDGDRESTDELTAASAGDSLPLGVPTRRERAVWQQWLLSMAEDAEAALAAAIAYRELDSASRESFLDSLELDAPEIDAPAVALYAPLLSVERDPARRSRLIEAIGPGIENARPRSEHRALVGRGPAGSRVYVLVIPLYLDFVQVLACMVQGGIFDWVKHDPIVSEQDAPREGGVIEGILLEDAPFPWTIDDIAKAVVSHRRSGGELPEALITLADLFRLGG